MGAGTSKSLRLHVLHDWSPQVDIPEKLETEARKLARLALRQAEGHPPQHRCHLHVSEPRPPWMDPTLLHVALAGPSAVALDAVLAALSCIAPLAEVLSDEEEGGALGQALEIGLRCFAFIDSELRILRLWVVLHARDLCGTALGLSRFDLLLWVQSSPSEEDAEQVEEDAEQNVLSPGVRAKGPLGSKQEDAADIQGAVVVSPGLPVRSFTGRPGTVVEVIDSLSFQVRFDDDESPAVRSIGNFKAQDGRPLELPPEAVQDSTQAGAQHSAESVADSPLFTLSPSSVFDQDLGVEPDSKARFFHAVAPTPEPSPSFIPKPRFLGAQHGIEAGADRPPCTLMHVDDSEAAKSSSRGDASHGAPDMMAEFGGLGDASHGVPDKMTKFGSSPPPSNSSSGTTLPPADGDDFDELTNAMPAEENQSQTAGRSLQGAESSSGLTTSSGLTLGSSSGSLQGAGSSVSQLVLQAYQEMECGVSLERLQELNQVLSKECITEEQRSKERTPAEKRSAVCESAPENELVVEQVASFGDAARSGHTTLEVASFGDAARSGHISSRDVVADNSNAHSAEAYEAPPVSAWQWPTAVEASEARVEKHEALLARKLGELNQALEEARVEKQRAAQAEDYDAAHEAKEREKALLTELQSLSDAVDASAEAATESHCEELEDALQRVRAEKLQAAEAGDYDAAHEAKEREKALLAELELLKGGPDLKTEQARLEEQLKQARAAKQAASEMEDYDAAYEAKELEKKLLAELEALHKQPRSSGCATLPKGAARWRVADDNLEGASGRRNHAAGAANNGRIPQALDKLARWADGRPPVIVAGQRGKVFEAVQCILPDARICELPASVLEGPHTASSLTHTAGFWKLLEAGLHMIASSRALPERDIVVESKEEDFGEGLKRGSPVRLCRLNGEALRLHNDKSGILIGMDKKGYLVRLWDDEVIQVFRNNLIHLNFKLAPPSPVMLTHMDRWVVKLKGLQSKSELNGQEGTTEPTSADGGRHNVRLKDGTIIAAKPANFEVLQRDRPELEGCVGLLDGYQFEESAKYKVLLVNPAGFGRVRLQGLVNKPELNGMEGSIISFKTVTQRYQVVLSVGGGEVRVKRVNMEFLEPQRITARALSLRPDRVDAWLDPDDEEMLLPT